MTKKFDPNMVLDVRKLHKEFTLHTVDGRTVEALNGISLTVSAGEHVALPGTSGAGKTSLSKTETPPKKPTSG